MVLPVPVLACAILSHISHGIIKPVFNLVLHIVAFQCFVNRCALHLGHGLESHIPRYGMYDIWVNHTLVR